MTRARRFRAPLVALCALLLASTFAASAPVPAGADPASAQRAGPLRYAMSVHLWRQDKVRVIDRVKWAGFGWLRQGVNWDTVEFAPQQYDWSELDAIVGAANTMGVQVLFTINQAPKFYRSNDNGRHGPPDDPNALYWFMKALAGRYAGKVGAYEIWNEQNLAVEWGVGKLDAGQYVELLMAAYQGVKEADPAALVITGALTPTGVNDWQTAADDVAYLRAMYAYKDGIIKKYYDHLGAHPSGYNNPPDDTPDLMTKPSDRFKGHWSFYFRRIEQLRAVMVENGEGHKQVWATELGWSSMERPPAGYEYAAEISEEEQAQYLVRAFEIARTEYPWLGYMSVWNLNFQTVVDDTDEKWGFGILRPDFTARPAYTLLAFMEK